MGLKVINEEDIEDPLIKIDVSPETMKRVKKMEEEEAQAAKAEQEDERKKIRMIDENVKNRHKFMKNPYYNREELKTKHGDYLDIFSLYKMGQISEEQMLKFKRKTKKKDTTQKEKEYP